jgi:predicted phage terminase large subunit-like protein
MFGGSAGGGKSQALLLAALQYAPVPGYSALLLRRSFRDLNQPDALIPRAKEWLGPVIGRSAWNDRDKRFTFPNGSTLTFGYLEHADDVLQYQGAAYQFCGMDELTQFGESSYRYLFSRLRRKEGVPIPIRMRSASNPGGPGHEWVRQRFLPRSGKLPPNRAFVPARLSDNPSLDQADYIASLNQLDPITRAQLLSGDWDAYEGGRFKRGWFKTFRDTGDGYLIPGRERVIPYTDTWRFAIVDPAATAEETTRRGDDADYTTIGTYCVLPTMDLLILDMVRKRLAIDQIVPTLASTCRIWRPLYVGFESVAFQAALIAQARQVPGMPAIRGLSPHLSGQKIGQKMKLTRATPAIIRTEAGQVFLPEVSAACPWVEDFLAELVQFTGDEKQDAHDDQVDNFSYAVLQVEQGNPFSGTLDTQPAPRPVVPGNFKNAERRGLFGKH